MIQPTSFDNLSIVRDATDEQLTDAAWLEDAIYRAGVYPAQEIPREVWSIGYGLGICQHPNQYAPYLVALSELPIKAYVEIGVWVGGTFAFTVEYLRRFGLEKAMAVDIEVKDTVKDYCRQTGVIYIEAPSTSNQAKKAVKGFKPDLILVDGDHTEEGARADYEFAASVAPYVAVHDIVGSGFPGVIKVWNEIDAPKQEWTAQYPGEDPSQNGMGLVTL